MRVLVSDNLSEVGVKILEQTPGIEVDVNTGLTHEELVGIIGQYEALVIRSATKVTADVIQAADKLLVIGRAGIGLDNVDIQAASQRGIVVMNAPEGNTITTAEHAIAMMLALSRNIPQATASLKEGKWEKKKLQGRELFNKTLGLVGAGHIGRIVADRAQGLKMKVIVYDPYIKPESIEKLDLEPVDFEDLLRRADLITIHTPKTEETTNMFNKETFSKMKKGAMLINCARGGIVNEDDLYDALSSGHLGGAALDVFSKEPPGKIRLMELPNFICTPHLGASTKEAQENVAKIIAEQIVDYLLHGTVKNAVNVPSISAELLSTLRPYVILVERMGALQAQLAEGAILETRIDYSGAVTEYDVSPLTTAMLKGLLTPIKDGVNFVNAPFIAAERGIKVVESKSKTSEDFASLIRLSVKTIEGENVVSGTIFGKKFPRILRINDFYLEAVPEGHNLLIHNEDRPGVIGMIGSTLGKHGVNIARMQVGQEPDKGQNVIFLATSSPAGEEAINDLLDLEHVYSVRRIEL
ncbi:MAG: phosphoglycerate dehydrogenase [Deltaproteobacteria bacterium]|nr:phosphoglycerate dehydrogenase [Deltaproteobacteria bacterium]MBW1928660.1 phosphoglycerate dehydrogenase [Deltaproteobacteria bacterium]MBW2025805.1 phosphoglycerate dehydrogenase [Deltaproteobacteria bacterium]MBW2125941.1 phosphoglycerate dehydrogenase [Deltaproteobacteria bacterium]RLB22417.1 MAG: phosphoglycerate dehydrogenase [Deltaproteobacteria bacterium]